MTEKEEVICILKQVEGKRGKTGQVNGECLAEKVGALSESPGKDRPV